LEGELILEEGPSPLLREDFNLSSEGLHDEFANNQAEPDTLGILLARALQDPEQLKELLLLRHRNAHSCVADLHSKAPQLLIRVVDGRTLDCDGPLEGKLERIGNQVEEDLLHPLLVSGDEAVEPVEIRELGHQLDADAVCLVSLNFKDLLHRFFYVKLFDVFLELIRSNSAEIQYVINEEQQQLG